MALPSFKPKPKTRVVEPKKYYSVPTETGFKSVEKPPGLYEAFGITPRESIMSRVEYGKKREEERAKKEREARIARLKEAGGKAREIVPADLSIWQKAKNKIADVIDPVTSALTGLTRRERAEVMISEDIGAEFRPLFAEKPTQLPIAESSLLNIGTYPGRIVARTFEIATQLGLELEQTVLDLNKEAMDVTEKDIKPSIQIPKGIGGLREPTGLVRGTRKAVDRFEELQKSNPAGDPFVTLANTQIAYYENMASPVANWLISAGLIKMGLMEFAAGPLTRKVARVKATELLGYPKDAKELVRVKNIMANRYHPFGTSPNKTLFDIGMKAYNLLSKRGIPSPLEIKTTLTLKKYTDILLSTAERRVINQTGPLIPSKALPGYKEIGKRQVRVGLQIQPVRKVVGTDIASKAVKAKTLGDFTKSLTSGELKRIKGTGFAAKTIYETVKREGIAPFVRKRETTLLKERFTNIARGAREGSITTRNDILKAGNDLKKTLADLDVSSEDQKHFIDTFKNIKSTDDLVKKLPKIIDRAERLANAKEIRLLKTDIQNTLKTYKPKIEQKKALESKIGAEAQEIVNFLRGNTKLSQSLTGRKTKAGNIISGIGGSREKALAKIESNINEYGKVVDGVTKEVPPEIAKQNAMLDMVGIQDMSVDKLREVAQNLNTLVEEGKSIHLIRQENKAKAAELDQIKDIAKEEFKPTKVKPAVVGEAGREINPVSKVLHAMDNALYSAEGLIEKATYGKDFAVSEWADDLIRNSRGKHTRLNVQWGNSKVKKFKEIFGEKRLSKTYKNLDKEELVWKGKNALGEEQVMKLSQFEAAYWWGLAKDPTNLPLFIKNMNFTPEMFKALDKSVSPKMKEYTNYLMNKWLSKIRTPVNNRYITKFGMNMPDNPNYMPRLYSDSKPDEEITNLLFGDSFPAHPSTVPSGVKARIGSKAGFKKISIEQVMRRHREQMNQFVTFDETISDLRRVFIDSEVKNTILSQRGGEQLYKTLTKKIDDIARGGMAAQMTLALVDKTIGRFTKATMMFNMVPFFKQLTSKPAFVLGRKGVTYLELSKGEIFFDMNPVGWTKKFCKSDFIYQRLTRGMTREMSIALREGNKDFTIRATNMSLGSFLKQAIVMPTRGGDMISILPGMTAKYIQTKKFLLKQGKLSAKEIEKRAMREAERLASRTQQDPTIESTGRIQSANSVGKAMSMYATTPIQYFREIISTGRMWQRKQVPFRTFLRTLITGWVVLPSLFQFAADGGTWNSERQKRALLLGPINFYPAVGDLITTIYDAFSKGETWKNMSSDLVSFLSILDEAQKGGKAFGDILLRDGDKEDWAEFTESLYTLFSQTTGKTPSTAPRTIEGIMDLIEGDTDYLRRIFFSEWALEALEEETSTPAPIRTGPSSDLPSFKPSSGGKKKLPSFKP